MHSKLPLSCTFLLRVVRELDLVALLVLGKSLQLNIHRHGGLDVCGAVRRGAEHDGELWRGGKIIRYSDTRWILETCNHNVFFMNTMTNCGRKQNHKVQ